MCSVRKIFQTRQPTVWWSVCSILLVVIFQLGCNKSKPKKAAKVEPAHVEHHVNEHDLNRITLTEQAENRLGIQLAPVRYIEVQRTRTIGGEVVLPPGKQVVVSAPFAGTLLPPDGGKVPAAGEQLQKGQMVFRFEPLLTAERDVLTPSEKVIVAQTIATVATAQIEADRLIESAKISVKAAQIQYERSKTLVENNAGSQRTLDQAKAQLELAQEALKTAHARSEYLSTIDLDSVKPGQIEQRDITSPVQGVLQSLDTATGETVSTGERLFSVMTTDDVWIRVPIYVGQWREIDTDQPARVSEFGSSPKTNPRKAMFASAPPSANPLAMTVDVFYAVNNSDGRLYPGQRLSVALPLKHTQKSLVIPFHAVVYDIHGGGWVYEEQAKHVYARRRVAVDFVEGRDAVLTLGPEQGKKVVTDGAAELFGTEFGVGH